MDGYVFCGLKGKIHPPGFQSSQMCGGKKTKLHRSVKANRERAMCLPQAQLDYAASERRNIMYHKSLMRSVQV